MNKRNLKRAGGLTLAAFFATGSIFSDGVMLTARAAGTGIPEAADVITVDGDISDWDFVRKLGTGSGGVAQAAAFDAGDSIYVMREYQDVSNYGGEQIFLDTDGDHTNGLYGTGADWVVYGDSLLKHNDPAGEWGWEEVAGTDEYDAAFQNDGMTGEIRIPKSLLGNPTGTIKINIGAYDKAWGTMAAYPAEFTYLDVPAFSEVYNESSTPVISDMTLNMQGELNAITKATMPGGQIGTFSAEGGDGTYTYSFSESATYGADNGRFVIDGNKLLVGDSLLQPGNYSIYVEAKSDIRSLKKAFSFVVSQASSAAPVSSAVFSGKKGQWFAVEHNAANSVPTLNELKAVTDGKDLYVYADAQTLSDNAEIYVKTSASGGEDMTDIWTGADSVMFKVDMSGNIYKHNASGWEKTGEADINKNGVGVEIKAPLSKLGNAAGEIGVGIVDDGASLPNKNQKMYTVTTPIMEDAPAITFDGEAGDWAGISPVASGNGTVGDLYAVRNNDMLYVMTHIKDAEMNSSYALSSNLLINADGNSGTGYQHPGYANGSGADFLVQDWFSNDFGGDSRNVEFFFTDNPTGGWVGKGSQTDYKIFKQEDGNTYCIEYAIPIDVMRESCNQISDDFYIAVNRQDPTLQDGTKSGAAPADSAFVHVPKYKTETNISVDDHTFGDWAAVSRSVKNSAAESTSNFYATRSEERLYTLVTNENGGLNTVNTYYISTGDNTGYEYDGRAKIDYIVKNAKLYKVTGKDTLSDSSEDIWMSYYNDNIEMQLYLDQIGSPKDIKVGWTGASGELSIPDNNGLMKVTASFNLEKEEGFYYPRENFASFSNPYKGWAQWATCYDAHMKGVHKFEFRTVYLDIQWSELEPERGVYDFSILESKYHLSDWNKLGVRVNLRFVMDTPTMLKDGETRRMDIPQWLYDELCAETEAGEIDNPGTFYNDVANIGGAGFSPNYKSEKLIQYYDEAIKALAGKFDNTSVTSFVQIGSLGHWGEFHTWPTGTGEWVSPATATRYMEPYVKYFKHVKVGLRKPYPYAAQNKFGLFNDIFGVNEAGGTPEYYGFIKNGCTDMGGGATSQEILDSRMPDFWKYNYSGGEFASGQIRAHITNETANDGSKGTMGCLDQVRYTHVSWLGPCSPGDITKDEAVADEMEPNVLALQKQMGYNFALDKITKYQTVSKGKETEFTMEWNNEGVAPFYYSWPVELSFIDKNGKVAYREYKDCDITNWLPGRSKVSMKVNIPASLASGEYTLAVAILDQDSLEPGLKLAVDGGRDDLRYPLYKVNVGAGGSGKAIDFSDDFSDDALAEDLIAAMDDPALLHDNTLTVTVNEGVKVKADVFAAAKEKGVNLSIKSHNEKAVFDFKADKLDTSVISSMSSFDPEVSIGKSNSVIDRLLRKLTKKILKVDVSFAYDGKLPGETEVTLDFSDIGFKEGERLYLYYFNPSGRFFELVDRAVLTSGKATFTMTHCSDYVVTNGALPAEYTAKSPKTGLDLSYGLMLISMMGAAAVGLMFTRKVS